jgi:hypothetical protein
VQVARKVKMKVKERILNIEHQKVQRRILSQDMVIFYGRNSKWYWGECGTGLLTNTCSLKYGLKSIESENKTELTNFFKYISPKYQGS